MSLSEDRTAVLLDQHPLWLDGVEQVLARVGINVVGKTTSPSNALDLLDSEHPDLFVTSIELPDSDVDGLTCLRRARERVPGVKVIIVSAYQDAEHIDAALEAGAAAYVSKTAHPDDIASAIRQAFDHSVYFAGHRQPAPVVAAPPVVDSSHGLTRRELEILQLVAEGRSNAQLAKLLWVTEQTVKFHLSNIYRKLDVANRTEASRWAQVRGLLPAAAAAPAA
jgi:DNA-binding NarL/FixJ family response regulator